MPLCLLSELGTICELDPLIDYMHYAYTKKL